MTKDVIELRLPPNAQYLPVFRATIGVIAGAMSFNYDQIVQLRVAVSEAFDLAIKYVTRVSEVNALAVRFTVEPDKLEILIPPPESYVGHGDSQGESEEEKESKVLLESLMDELEFGAGDPGKPIVRMVKYQSARAA